MKNANWDFDDECFEEISEPAKDFISGLLIRDPLLRRSVADCMKHEWLNLDLEAMKHSMRKPVVIDDDKKIIDTSKLKKYLSKKKWRKMAAQMRCIQSLNEVCGKQQ